MIQKQVVINNGVYDCDIDVTVDEWKKILEDKNIKENNYIDMLIKFYNEPEHKSTCKAIGEKYNISPQSPNSIITNFAKAAQKILNRFEVKSTEGKPTYWIIPMTGKYIENNNFEWTMRPELVQAIEELKIIKQQIKINSIEALVRKVNSDLKEFGEKFNYKRKELAKMKRSNSKELFVYNDKTRDYAINSGSGTEVQYHIFIRDNEIGYGLGFNTQFVPFKYDMTLVEYMKPFADAYLYLLDNKDNTIAKMKESEFYYIYGGENELRKLEDKEYILFGKTINVISDSISEDDYNKMLDYLKGDIFDLYIKIWETKNSINIINNNIKDINTIINLLNSKKQIILQGAPGTGKTFTTSEIAVALCDGVDNIPPTREKIMERYNKLVDEERIAFTTFHQSMDYEEFIEGIKPVKDSNPMRFDVQDGILKQICCKANAGISINNNDLINIDSAIEWLKDKVKTNSIVIQTKRGAIFNLSYKDGNNRFTTIPENAQGKQKDNYGASFEDIKIYFNEGRENLHNISYVRGIVNYLKNNYLSKPYVLIIDEINRGNISKILGELITLLEADKRIGEENELQATLPYSNKKFSVPSNLYIIGTMNTADRSLGYIDYAVRRRFAFYTLQADRSVIENYYQNNEALKSEAINLFDEVQKLILKNIASEFNVEDLMIGHSYFLIDDEDELNLKLEYEIKPLLLEYAFDGILDKLKKVDGKYKEIENLGNLSNIITNNQDDSENGED